MKVYKKTLLIVLLLVSSLFACEKEITELPEITNEGKNTIGYNYGEKLKGGIFGDARDDFSFGENEIKIVFNEWLNGQGTNYMFGVLELNFFYSDPSDISLTDGRYTISHRKMSDVYSLDTSETNFMEISYMDQEKKILSGLFDLNFVFIDSIYKNDSLILKKGETKHLTNGQFDLMEIE